MFIAGLGPNKALFQLGDLIAQLGCLFKLEVFGVLQHLLCQFFDGFIEIF